MIEETESAAMAAKMLARPVRGDISLSNISEILRMLISDMSAMDKLSNINQNIKLS